MQREARKLQLARKEKNEAQRSFSRKEGRDGELAREIDVLQRNERALQAQIRTRGRRMAIVRRLSIVRRNLRRARTARVRTLEALGRCRGRLRQAEKNLEEKEGDVASREETLSIVTDALRVTTAKYLDCRERFGIR